MNYTQNIRNRIANTAQEAKRQNRQEQVPKRPRQPQVQVQAQDIYIPKKEQSGFWGAFLATCVLLLGFATLPIMYYKGQSQETTVPPTVVERQRDAKTTPQGPVVPDDRFNDTMVARLTDVEKGYKAQQHRLWLIVLAHNENAHLMEQMDSAHHKVNDRGFITFDENWKINRIPETMKLTPEQIEQIQNGPK